MLFLLAPERWYTVPGCRRVSSKAPPPEKSSSRVLSRGLTAQRSTDMREEGQKSPHLSTADCTRTLNEVTGKKDGGGVKAKERAESFRGVSSAGRDEDAVVFCMVVKGGGRDSGLKSTSIDARKKRNTQHNNTPNCP